MTATHPCDLTIAEAAALMARRELSPVELVESCLERIDALEERLRAWAWVNREGALAEARRCEEELWQGGARGPLHGIPIGLKDIICTAGMPTEAGSRILVGWVPDYDATCAARLREAGAIILGKTRTTEFALLDPAPTRNPWNLDHTPGGSSSGSGAGVAARMCPVALGSQTGGSTLRPAAYNGVVGLKPRHGRISAYGVYPISGILDHVGILARSVEDAALTLQAIAGYDAQDPYSLNEPVPDYRAALDAQARPPRLGLARRFFYEHADEEMRRHVDEVAERLARAGAQVEEVALPPAFGDARDAQRTIMFVDAAAQHQETFAARKEDYGPMIRGIIEEGLEIPAVRYARALADRLRLRAETRVALERFDAVITPGAPGVAPHGLASTGDSVMQQPWTLLGFPTVALPTGLGRSGLPLAVQLAATPDAEARLLAVARWCEEALHVYLRPPL